MFASIVEYFPEQIVIGSQIEANRQKSAFRGDAYDALTIFLPYGHSRARSAVKIAMSASREGAAIAINKIFGKDDFALSF